MAQLDQDQLRRRAQVESIIKMISPALDLMLAVGDRVSKVSDRSNTPAALPAKPVRADATRDER